jgi:hypothetical protein
MKGKLPDRRRKKLEEIYFPFQCVSKYNKRKNYTPQHMEQWEKMYMQREEYHKANHDCIVPYNYEPNPTLGHWVSKQRADFKIRVMGQERQDRLAKLQFTWTLEKSKRYKEP